MFGTLKVIQEVNEKQNWPIINQYTYFQILYTFSVFGFQLHNHNHAILGMMDGNMTVLTIADLKSKRGKMNDYLKALPSRNKGKNLLVEAGFTTSCKD